MDPALALDVLYGGVIVVFLLIIVLSRRARRHGGALQAGVVGAIYDLQNRDKQRALDVIVEGKAAATEPEHAEDVMDEALRLMVEMNEAFWNGFKRDLEDATPEEVDWRPLPEANTINLIVRHLLIEAEGHVARVEGPEGPGPAAANDSADLMPLDFAGNMERLDDLHSRFIDGLRRMTLPELEARSSRAYEGKDAPPHYLGFHMAGHLARHWGQVRTIRNLYRMTRGQTGRFFPDNPTFPR